MTKYVAFLSILFSFHLALADVVEKEGRGGMQDDEGVVSVLGKDLHSHTKNN